MYRLLIDEQEYYFKNKSTLIDFLDDNLPVEGASIPLRSFHIKYL